MEVKRGGETIRVEMKNGKGEADLPKGTDFTVDPSGWILMDLIKS